MDGPPEPSQADVVRYACGELTGPAAQRVHDFLEGSLTARAVFRVARDLLTLEVDATAESTAVPPDALERLLTQVRRPPT